MTKFLSVSDVSRIVKSQGIEKTLIDMAEYILDDYRRWNDFDKTARTAAHSEKGVIELMPTSDGKLYGFKYVNGHPANVEKNILTIMAFGALADVETGKPLMISEMTLLTALRTGATSAAVAKYLARSNSRTMAVIGNGAQSEFQILAFKALMGIEEVRLYDIDVKATEKLMSNLKTCQGLKIVQANSAREAVKGADIVTTVTADKTKAIILTADMIEAGMHINAVGGDCPGKTELHADVLTKGRVFVEYEPQTRIEGEIQQMPADFPVTEITKLATGEIQGRENASDVTIFDSVGFAIADFSALRYIHDVATKRGYGAYINVVPMLENPKDLYGLLSRAED